jgi:CubicO group peptidase (beta-lactamase class C family)
MNLRKGRFGKTFNFHYGFLTFLLAVVMALSACGQSGTASTSMEFAALPIGTDKPNQITSGPILFTPEQESASNGLVPITYQRFGIKTLLPEGWIEGAPGIFIPADTHDGFPQLYYLAYPGLPLDLITASVVLPSIGYSELPERSGILETASLTWDSYIVEPQDHEIGDWIIQFGLSETETGSYIMALVCDPEDYDRLRDEIYLPALQFFEPVEYGERDHLTYDDLIAIEARDIQPVNNHYFMPIGGTEAALHSVEGTLTVSEFEMSFSNLEGALGLPGRGFFPGFSVQFFTYGDDLVPVDRDIISSSGKKSYWRIILSPGKVWSEPGDRGMSRASFPFVLISPDYNETHNGVGTFLYNEEEISNFRFQVIQETATWDKTDYWGQTEMGYTPQILDQREGWIDAFSQEVNRQIPIQPWTDLRASVDPDILVDFDPTIDPIDISATGLIWDGTIYLQPCMTRYGIFPYPRYMRHGVYSVTKSMGAAIAMLRLAEVYGEGVFNLKIRDYVEISAEHDGWEEVTFGNALNMATGVGETPEISNFTGDEDKQKFSHFLLARSMEEKLEVAFSYANYDWGPGEQARYNSINTFVLSAAMLNFLKSKAGSDADIWDMVLEEVYKPIGIFHAPIMRTIEADGSRGIPIFGYGLYPTVDDVAKVASLYQNGGKYQGQQILNANKVDEALYRTEVQGFPNGARNAYGESRYNYSFWSSPYRTATGAFFQIPYMTGFGGNLVVLMPNGMTTFRFSDSFIYDVETMIRAADSLKMFEAR